MSVLGTRLEEIREHGSEGGVVVDPLSASSHVHHSIKAASESSRDGVLDKIRSNISTFWRRQIVLVSDSDGCRDHFANERTFLGYLRTSSAFATLGIAGFQLFLLDSGKSDCRSQYGKALAFTCEAAAIIIALSGCYRFWRQQNAMFRGKVHAGGWELYTVGFCGFTITIMTIVLVLLTNCDD